MSGIDRKAQILKEATRLFSRYGYDKVTIKELAKACGITEPALYRHFQSKEAIYDTVLTTIESRLADQEFFSRLTVEDNLEVLLDKLARHIIDYFTLNEDCYRLLMFSALAGHARSKEVFDLLRGTYTRFLAGQLDRLLLSGSIVEMNNELTARCFTGMVFDCAMYASLWKTLQGQQVEPCQMIANNVPIYVRGLRKEPA
jgi:AcrR family transcriptional regulator